MKKSILKKLIKDKMNIISLLILGFWVIASLSHLIFPSVSHIPVELQKRLSPPSWNDLLGVDGNGQSLAKLIISGAHISFSVSLVTVSLCLIVGVPMGLIAGYFGGIFDTILSRIIDILLSFPPLILPIAIMSFFGAGFWNVCFAMAVTGWVSYARLVRAQTLSFREREFVQAARALGAHSPRIIYKHVFPNTLSPLIVQTTFFLATVIITESGLSFLGLGVNGNSASLGSLLNNAKDYLTTNPSLAFFPSLALFSVVMSLNFLGESLRILTDPKHQ